MTSDTGDRESGTDSRQQTRREFIGRAICAGAAAGLCNLRGIAAMAAQDAAKAPSPLPIAHVVRAYSAHMMPVSVIHRTILKDALEESVKLIAGEDRISDAWHQILKPDDVILIKFNQSGAENIGTTRAMAAELVESLQKAGWSPSQVMLLEAVGASPSMLRTTRQPDRRWQHERVNFGVSGKDSFVAALDQATAIINVPFIKTHHMTTLTGCLKNLSHGLIQHPARFHEGGCDPAIAEIVASDAIRSKVRLNIMNGIRCVVEGGPKADPEALVSCNTLFVGVDPVACDATAFGFLNEVRSLRGKPPLLKGASLPIHLQSATKRRIGQSDLERIRVTRVDV
ncbi:hypothetical protein B7486_02715 [cyanobacterium TDX16]|nr:hypothetical protein B7486_02715 [cyanobacterium TDX16]